jgi:hypothetical protein
MLSFNPALWLLLAFLLGAGFWRLFFYLPGSNYRGPQPPLTGREKATRARVREILQEIAGNIGERNLSRKPAELHRCIAWIERKLRAAGYNPWRQEFRCERQLVWNLVTELPGSDPSLPALVVGAHYDTVPFSPGANDNGSAVAALLAMAENLREYKPRRTVRFVFFANEESPYFGTNEMGSLVHAESCRSRKEPLMGAVILETIGCYLNAAGTQNYPAVLAPFFPGRGDFVAFVANFRSRRFLHQVVSAFRRNSYFPSEGIAAPEKIRDICRSDQSSFWRCGYPAVMVTDTANFRYEHYHTPEDTIDKINFDAMARVIVGVENAVMELAGIDG